MMLNFADGLARSFYRQHELDNLMPLLETAAKQLRTGTGAGAEFTGWYNTKNLVSAAELEQIEEVAAKIRQTSDIFVVIGIGGSYLGARAVIEALGSHFPQLEFGTHGSGPLVLFAGQNLSSDYLAELRELIRHYRVSLNVVSKSGTTTEPAIAFRVLRELLAEQYDERELRERIIITTDQHKGALRSYADESGLQSFVVPESIGGRYSVLTPVGLLALAVSGIDLRELLAGARWAEEKYSKLDPAKPHDCARYAALRHIFRQRGYEIELLVNYEPSLLLFAEWWKQLYGESEGKDGRGLFPASVSFTTDLHSLGQYIQDGGAKIFETVLNIARPQQQVTIPADDENLDKLNYLAGKNLHEINRTAGLATALAHVAGGVPNLSIELAERSPEAIGALIYFFELGCALSGYLNAVNPFDQPGVEAYKKNMFALLGKPGFETERKRLENKLAEIERK